MTRAEKRKWSIEAGILEATGDGRYRLTEEGADITGNINLDELEPKSDASPREEPSDV